MDKLHFVIRGRAGAWCLHAIAQSDRELHQLITSAEEVQPDEWVVGMSWDVLDGALMHDTIRCGILLTEFGEGPSAWARQSWDIEREDGYRACVERHVLAVLCERLPVTELYALPEGNP